MTFQNTFSLLSQTFKAKCGINRISNVFADQGPAM